MNISHEIDAHATTICNAQQEEEEIAPSTNDVIAATPVPFPPTYLEQSLSLVAGVPHVNPPVFNMDHLSSLDFLPPGAMIAPFAAAAAVNFMHASGVQSGSGQTPPVGLEQNARPVQPHSADTQNDFVDD